MNVYGQLVKAQFEIWASPPTGVEGQIGYNSTSKKFQIYNGTTWLNIGSDVTLAAVGATPNANGASLTDQALNLQPANGSFPGVLTALAQTIGGDKTFQDNVLLQKLFSVSQLADGATTGTAAVLPAPTKVHVLLTNSSLVSLGTIVAPTTPVMLIITNKTGVQISVLNDTGATAADRILTGTGSTATVVNDASLILVYDLVNSRWAVLSGAAAGFNNPMTTGGDIIYGGASGAPTRLANGTSGQYLKSTGGTSAPAWQSLVPPTIQKFTSGSGTYTTPSGVTHIRVRAIGGGGGGGGSGTGATAGNGSSGGNTTFGSSLITANGGGGGLVNVAGPGGTTGLSAPALGTPMSGNSGSYGLAIGTSFGIAGGGTAGAGPFGGAPSSPGGAAGGNAVSGSGSGGGGGGLAVAGNCGGGGGSGGFVDAVIPSPSATYAYSVGANGTGGTAGTSGFAGGNGGTGYIEVTEYYQ